jgi:hypothetical protein
MNALSEWQYKFGLIYFTFNGSSKKYDKQSAYAVLQRMSIKESFSPDPILCYAKIDFD